jgi:hypothetical protein
LYGKGREKEGGVGGREAGMGTSLSSLFYVVGFKFNMKKCNFVQPEIKFVPAQIDKIHGVRQPSTTKT